MGDDPAALENDKLGVDGDVARASAPAADAGRDLAVAQLDQMPGVQRDPAPPARSASVVTKLF